MARVKKQVVNKAGITETVEEEVETTPEVGTDQEVTTPVTISEGTMVTNVTISLPANSDAKPGPEVKMNIAPTLSEKAITIDVGDTVAIVGIRGFDGIVGKVQEVRPDGYVVVRAKTGTFATPKANVEIVK